MIFRLKCFLQWYCCCKNFFPNWLILKSNNVLTSYNLYFYSFWKTVPRRIKLCRKFRRKSFLCWTKSILLRIFCLWTLMLIFVETCLSVLAGPDHRGHSNLWVMMGGGGGGAWHHMESHWHVACSRDTWPWQCRTRATRDSLQQRRRDSDHSLILQANGCHSQRKSKLSIWNWILCSYKLTTACEKTLLFRQGAMMWRK